MSVKSICEAAAAAEFRIDGSGKQRKVSFSLAAVTEALKADEEFRTLAPSAVSIDALSERAATYTLRCLVRFALFGQFVNDAVTTTWYMVRWTDALGIGDPRYAPVEKCMEMVEHAAQLIKGLVETPDGLDVIEKLALADRQQDGLPLDYVSRTARPFHDASNITLLDTELGKELVTQRSVLLNRRNNPAYGIFKAAYDKLRVKTYLTDRVLTGVHKTNRELRWEVHPESVQSALKKDAMQIESVLAAQLCHLAGMPQPVRDYLQTAGLIQGNEAPQLCPVTRDPLQWDEFEAEMLNADHGRSLFQVGHLNPLKSNPDRNPEWGHSAANVSWISQDGNRIQGHLSLDEVRELLERIADNYARLMP